MNSRYVSVLALLVLVSVPSVVVSHYDAKPRDASNVIASDQRPQDQPVVVPPNRNRDRDLAYYLSLPVDSQQRVAGVAAAREAQALADANQLPGALEAYDRAMTLLPNLGDWLDLFAAGVAATLGDTAEVTRRLQGLDSVLITDWAWRSRMRAYRNAEDRPGALQLARAAGDLPGPARRRAEALQWVGVFSLEASDSAAARTAFARSMSAWPNSDVALESARLLSDLRGLRLQHHLAIGRIYLRYGNTTRGLESLNRYLQSPNANADTSARVRLEIGRAYFDAGKYREAERILALVKGRDRSAAMFLTGRAQYRQNREAVGRRTLASVVTRYPESDAAPRAVFLMADLDHDARKLASAATGFARVIRMAPGSEYAGISHMRLATISLSKGDTAAAVSRLERYRESFPRGARHQQAAYWTGKLYGELGNKALADARLKEALDHDPLSFYGERAATLQDVALTRSFAPDPVTPADANTVVAAALLRLDLLRELGWVEAAAFEVQRVRSYFDADTGALLALAEGLNERGRTSAGITLGRELMQSHPPSLRLLRIVYPFPYRDLVANAAREQGIDPFFMAALIRQESWFNPTATSSAGAQGLMQVMPATARVLARSMGIAGFSTAMLHDPATNIRIGSRFLADMIRTWSGRPDYVLAAYNAGPGRMERWLQFPETRDPELFMERIPFDETRDYVRVVQLNARIYAALYGSDPSAPPGR